MPEHLNLKSSKKVSEQLRHQLELWVEISLVTHPPAQAGLVQSGVRDLGVYVTCNMFLLLPPILPNPKTHMKTTKKRSRSRIMKQNYKIFKSNPFFLNQWTIIGASKFVCFFLGLGLGLHFESSQVASLIYQGEVEVWEFGWTWPGDRWQVGW